jgi:type II secretory pathway pseudopilin PulG
MSEGSKLWSLAGRFTSQLGRVESGVIPEAEPNPAEPPELLLGKLAQLDASIADSKARQDAELAARAARAKLIERADDVNRTPGPETLPQSAAPGPNEPTKMKVTMPDEVQVQPVASDDVTAKALRIIAEQRKAAEALLFEACALEDRLKTQAKGAQAAAEYAAAQAKAESAVLTERKAKQVALTKRERRAALATERARLGELLATKRPEGEAARVKITELEQGLAEAQRSAEQIFSVIAAHEAREKECAEEEIAVEREATEAAARVTACQAEREAAEKAATAAGERVRALKKELSINDVAGIEEARTLAARIAEQAAITSRSHNGSH